MLPFTLEPYADSPSYQTHLLVDDSAVAKITVSVADNTFELFADEQYQKDRIAQAEKESAAKELKEKEDVAKEEARGVIENARRKKSYEQSSDIRAAKTSDELLMLLSAKVADAAFFSNVDNVDSRDWLYKWEIRSANILKSMQRGRQKKQFLSLDTAVLKFIDRRYAFSEVLRALDLCQKTYDKEKH